MFHWILSYGSENDLSKDATEDVSIWEEAMEELEGESDHLPNYPTVLLKSRFRKKIIPFDSRGWNLFKGRFSVKKNSIKCHTGGERIRIHPLRKLHVSFLVFRFYFRGGGHKYVTIFEQDLCIVLHSTWQCAE